MKIHWSEDPSKAPKSSFTKHLKNQAKINKSFILGTSKTSQPSKSHRFYNVFWTPSCGNHLTVSGDPKSASRPIFATSLKRYKKYWFGHKFDLLRRLPRDQHVNITKDVCKKSPSPPGVNFRESLEITIFPKKFHSF